MRLAVGIRCWNTLSKALHAVKGSLVQHMNCDVFLRWHLIRQDCGYTCSCSTSTSPSEHLRISWGNVEHQHRAQHDRFCAMHRGPSMRQHAVRAHCYFSSVVPFSDAVEKCALHFIHVNGTVFAILKSKCEGIFGVKCILSHREAAGSKVCR